MYLIEILQRIHQANFASEHGPFSTDYIRRYLTDDGFQSDDDVPAWFVRIMRLVDAKEAEQALFEDDNGSMASLLLELKETHGWDVEDYGEGVAMVFPGSNIRVFISREANDANGRHSCSYCVTLSDRPTFEP